MCFIFSWPLQTPWPFLSVWKCKAFCLLCCYMVWFGIWAWTWRFKHTRTHRETGTWITLDTRMPRMPPLLYSGAAYVGLWPSPSSWDLSVAAPPEITPLPTRSYAQSSCWLLTSEENKLFTEKSRSGGLPSLTWKDKEINKCQKTHFKNQFFST